MTSKFEQTEMWKTTTISASPTPFTASAMHSINIRVARAVYPGAPARRLPYHFVYTYEFHSIRRMKYYMERRMEEEGISSMLGPGKSARGAEIIYASEIAASPDRSVASTIDLCNISHPE
jgi:hypothetical protein